MRRLLIGFLAAIVFCVPAVAQDIGGVRPHGAAGLAAATPASNSGTTLKMLGLGGSSCTFTPTVSGNVQVTVLLNVSMGVTAAAGDGVKYELLWGTGTAPVNGATLTGTLLGSQVKPTFPAAATSASLFQVSQPGVITGAVVGTPIWFDAAESDANANHSVGALGAICTWAEVP